MHSSASCAWSGAFVVAGALTAVSWVFVRALSMHLQICWDITPGKRFFYWSQLLGWAAPAIVFIASITASGVSFRFGPAACHINHANSVATFFSWTLVSAGITIVLQLATVFYCLHIYLRNLWADDELRTQASEGGAPTYSSSAKSQPVSLPGWCFDKISC